MLSPKEARAKWVEALRSGKYKQIKGRLEKIDKETSEVVGNCCLGVACRLYMEDGGKLDVEQRYCLGENNVTQFDCDTNVLPIKVQEWLGLSNSNMGRYFIGKDAFYLSDINDQGKSFEEIANIIESGMLDIINESETSGKDTQKVN